MRVSHINGTLRNPAAPDRAWQGSFLVETGAINSPVPRWEPVGLKLKRLRAHDNGDDREVTMTVAIGEPSP